MKKKESKSSLWNRIKGEQTSKSKFPTKSSLKPGKTEIRELKSNWMGSLILGLWDNTCGPRIDQVPLFTFFFSCSHHVGRCSWEHPR